MNPCEKPSVSNIGNVQSVQLSGELKCSTFLADHDYRSLRHVGHEVQDPAGLVLRRDRRNQQRTSVGERAQCAQGGLDVQIPVSLLDYDITRT